MIGLFGGSFDPIHEGHLSLAKALVAEYGFEKLFLVPAKKNPLKKNTTAAPAEARLEMVRLAIEEAGDSRLAALDWEVRSPSPSYTIATVDRLIDEFKKPVALVMGNEVFEGLERWHEPARLLSEADLIVVRRVEHSAPDVEGMLARLGIAGVLRTGNRIYHSSRAHWIDDKPFHALPISATGLRKAIAQAWARRDMSAMPQGIGRKVWLFIKENRLYSVTR